MLYGEQRREGEGGEKTYGSDSLLSNSSHGVFEPSSENSQDLLDRPIVDKRRSDLSQILHDRFPSSPDFDRIPSVGQNLQRSSPRFRSKREQDGRDVLENSALNIGVISNVTSERIEEETVGLVGSNNFRNLVQRRSETLSNLVALVFGQSMVIRLHKMPILLPESQGDGWKVESAHDGSIGVFGGKLSSGFEDRIGTPGLRPIVEGFAGSI